MVRRPQSNLDSWVVLESLVGLLGRQSCETIGSSFRCLSWQGSKSCPFKYLGSFVSVLIDTKDLICWYKGTYGILMLGFHS